VTNIVSGCVFSSSKVTLQTSFVLRYFFSDCHLSMIINEMQKLSHNLFIASKLQEDKYFLQFLKKQASPLLIP